MDIERVQNGWVVHTRKNPSVKADVFVFNTPEQLSNFIKNTATAQVLEEEGKKQVGCKGKSLPCC